MAAKQRFFTVNIPKAYKPAQRVAIAAEIIDYIRKRTARGKDKNNSKFPGYSKDYVKSLDFKIAGKSKSNVNLKLTGDMLAAIDLLKHEPGKLKIGFEAGTEENGRAEGNILGTYGQKTSTGKKRDFLGITNEDLKKKILSKFDPGEMTVTFANRKAKNATVANLSVIREGDEVVLEVKDG